MAATAHLHDAERRARAVTRHHLGGTAPDAEAAVAAVVAMHSSDPLTPVLGTRARLTDEVDAAADLDRALHVDRTLWRLHAVRRTLFVATVDDALVLEAAAGRDVAAKERRRLLGWLTAALGDEATARTFVDEVSDEVLAVLADGVPRGTTELTQLVPRLAQPIELGSGRWATTAPVSSRLLFLLAMDGATVRAAPAGSWRGSRYAWVATGTWFGRTLPWRDEVATARAELLRRYLAQHGPATVDDVRWWSGWTVAATRAAVAAVAPGTVTLDGGVEGLVLPGDEEPEAAPADRGTVALLPGLDPTPMGWKGRGWYLGPADGPAATRLWDRNGNVGPTVWLDGRVVGGWATRADGEVVARLLEDVGADAVAAVDAAAADLTRWLDGTRLTPRFRTPLERELTAEA